jgi:hypothetical protein
MLSRLAARVQYCDQRGHGFSQASRASRFAASMANAHGVATVLA